MAKKTLNERVTYYESPFYAIKKKIEERGYIPACATGMNLNERGKKHLRTTHDYIGILSGTTLTEGCCFGFKRKRQAFIGRLCFDNEDVGADPDKNWILEVYGRENIPELMELVKEISKPYNVKVKIELASEKTKTEERWSDLGP